MIHGDRQERKPYLEAGSTPVSAKGRGQAAQPQGISSQGGAGLVAIAATIASSWLCQVHSSEQPSIFSAIGISASERTVKGSISSGHRTEESSGIGRVGKVPIPPKPSIYPSSLGEPPRTPDSLWDRSIQGLSRACFIYWGQISIRCCISEIFWIPVSPCLMVGFKAAIQGVHEIHWPPKQTCDTYCKGGPEILASKWNRFSKGSKGVRKVLWATSVRGSSSGPNPGQGISIFTTKTEIRPIHWWSEDLSDTSCKLGPGLLSKIIQGNRRQAPILGKGQILSGSGALRCSASRYHTREGLSLHPAEETFKAMDWRIEDFYSPSSRNRVPAIKTLAIFSAQTSLQAAGWICSVHCHPGQDWDYPASGSYSGTWLLPEAERSQELPHRRPAAILDDPAPHSDSMGDQIQDLPWDRFEARVSWGLAIPEDRQDGHESSMGRPAAKDHCSWVRRLKSLSWVHAVPWDQIQDRSCNAAAREEEIRELSGNRRQKSLSWPGEVLPNSKNCYSPNTKADSIQLCSSHILAKPAIRNPLFQRETMDKGSNRLSCSSVGWESDIPTRYRVI